MFTNRKSKRTIAGLAVLAIAATGLISATTASAALPPANTPPAGPVTLTPASGTGTSNISINPGATAACQGDSATNGYRWQTFIAANSVDTSQFIYNNGPTLAGSTAFFSNLYSQGNPVIDGNTAIGTGVLTNFPSAGYQLNIFDGLITTTGLYKIGLACSLAGETTRFWQTTIQITANATSITGFSPFVAPAAPVLASPLTAGSGTLAGTFTQAAATPAVTGYTVTATPASGPAVTLTLAAGATSFTLSGLTNGTAYNVSVTSTNTAGTSVPSNVVSGSPADPNQRPAVTALAGVPGSSNVALSWVAPTGVAPLSYTVTVTPTVAGSPFTVPVGTTTLNVTGLAESTSYSFTVTPNHTAPFFAPATTTTVFTQSASSIIQDISVTRPIGGLVLTQQCGLYGTLGAEVADNFFPALALAAASGTGTIPTGETAAKYAQYPYPVDALNVPNPTYPTRCALDLGIADLIRSGPEAGKYFRTTGRLNQVTVVDTRNADTGWTLSGSASNFTSGANSFSGNYLGWTPFTSGTSGLTFDGYDQLTAAGPQVAPQGTASTTGLASSQVLGSANANSGLGIASFDARIKLLIPVTADNGVYTATLTLSALPKP